MYLHVNQPVQPPHEVEPAVPRAVSAVVTRMLAKEPDQRFETPLECAAALFEAAGVPMPARASSGRLEPALDRTIPRITGPIAVRAVPRDRTLTWLVAVVVGLVVLVAVWFAFRPGVSVPSAGPVEPAGTSGILDENFVLISGGTVTIGHDVVSISESHPDCKISEDEAPAHTVELAPYALSKFEVTNREYREFLIATGHQPPKRWKDGSFLEGTEMYPVTGVTWHDAVAYCEWRSRQGDITYRLPSEQEWEHAARKNDDRLWPWNSIWNSSYANCGKKSTEGSVMAIDKPPNNTEDRSPFGVFAMAGNVAEWTSSRPEPYPQSTWPRRKGIETFRVVRGGSFNTGPNETRTTYRAWYAEGAADDKIGFRIAYTPREAVEEKP